MGPLSFQRARVRCLCWLQVRRSWRAHKSSQNLGRARFRETGNAQSCISFLHGSRDYGACHKYDKNRYNDAALTVAPPLDGWVAVAEFGTASKTPAAA